MTTPVTPQNKIQLEREKAKNNNAPNTNLAHIIDIEGLTSQIKDHLQAIKCTTDDQKEAKADAVDVLGIWERNDFAQLRYVFE